MRIERAPTPSDWAAAEALIREYAASLGISLEFQRFEEEIENLRREYGPPKGVKLLARDRDEYLGCGGVRRYSEDACEMKRLYVRPAAQGRGIGRALAVALIDEARRLGYRRILLDTLPSMRGALPITRVRRDGPLPVQSGRGHDLHGTESVDRPGSLVRQSCPSRTTSQ